jgi:hypothetical protein
MKRGAALPSATGPFRAPRSPHPIASRPPFCSRNVARPKNDASDAFVIGLAYDRLVSPDTRCEDSPGFLRQHRSCFLLPGTPAQSPAFSYRPLNHDSAHVQRGYGAPPIPCPAGFPSETAV